MSEEIIFETLNEKRYAPSSQDFSSSLFDADLEKEFQQIPDKLAFKIGEVAEMMALKPYVLRYWETEFEQFRPQKSSKNQRIFSRKDVETAFMIRKLLHRDRFSIEGARSALKRLRKDSKQIKAMGGRHEGGGQEALRADVEDLLFQISSLKKLFR